MRHVWHKYHSWYFKIVSNYTRPTAREMIYNNFKISLMVFTPNITTNHAITCTNLTNLQGDHWLNCHRLLTFLQSCHWSRHYFHCYLQLKTNHRKKNKMSKGQLLILIQLHGTHILLRKVSSTHVQIFFNMKFFFFAFKILCLHTWCIQIIFALPGKDTLICTSMQIQ